MAQLVAHHTGSVGVRGSNPLSSTKETLRAAAAGSNRTGLARSVPVYSDACAAVGVVVSAHPYVRTVRAFAVNPARARHFEPKIRPGAGEN
jgi:hypothetical protein